MLRILLLITLLSLTEAALLHGSGFGSRYRRLLKDYSENSPDKRNGYAIDDVDEIEQYHRLLLNSRRDVSSEEQGERLTLLRKVATNDVSSVTTLGGKLFTLDTVYHRISVYNAKTYEHVRDVTLAGFTDPKDIVACSATNSLYLHEYLIDFQGSRLVNRSGIIWRTSIDWKLKFKWKVWKAGAIVSSSISVSDNGDILLAEGDQYKPDLVLYRPDGGKIKLIPISHLISSDHYFIWHAVQSRSSPGNIIVSYNTVDSAGGSRSKQWHGVIEIPGNGKRTLHSFGNVIQPYSAGEPDGFGYPWQLATEKGGSVFAVDRWRNQIVALSADLNEEEAYIKDDRAIPLCLWLDSVQNVLLVGVYRGLDTYSEIYVYKINT